MKISKFPSTSETLVIVFDKMYILYFWPSTKRSEYSIKIVLVRSCVQMENHSSFKI